MTGEGCQGQEYLNSCNCASFSLIVKSNKYGWPADVLIDIHATRQIPIQTRNREPTIHFVHEIQQHIAKLKDLQATYPEQAETIDATMLDN